MEPPPPRKELKYGLATGVGRKEHDEDRHFIDGAAGCFAVFDGHGGSVASILCEAEFASRVKAEFADAGSVGAAAHRVCWQLDAKLLDARETAGTTACFLWVEADKSTLAWVGDSGACCVDMLSPGGAYTMTRKHVPEVFAETELLRSVWECRTELARQSSPSSSRSPRSLSSGSSPLISRTKPGEDEKSSGASGLDAGFSPLASPSLSSCRSSPAAPMLSQAELAALMLLTSPEQANARLVAFSAQKQQELMPMAREGLMADAMRRSTKVDEVYAAIYEQLGVRRTSTVGKRVHPLSGAPVGPSVVISGGYGGDGANVQTIQMSRSIGDSDAGRAVLPELEIEERPVRTDEYLRYVIATDGLWDNVSMDKVARLVARKNLPPEQAANRLLRATLLASCARGHGTFADDTSILVVDVNPMDLTCAVKSRRPTARLLAALAACAFGQRRVEPSLPP